MKYSSWTRPLTLIAMSTTATLSHAAFNPQAALKMLNNPSAYSEAQLTEMANKIASENPQYGSNYWDSLEASLTAITPSPSAPVNYSVKGSSAEKLTCALLIWESKSLLHVPMNQLFSHRAAFSVERNAARINLSKTLNLSNPFKGTMLKDNVTPLRRARSDDYTLTKVDNFMTSDTTAYLPKKMSMLTMMGDHFGWDTCRSIIHEIQAMPSERYSSNQKRMDLWLTLLGKKIGSDVSPAMESWQWTFSNSAKGEVSHLPPFNALEQSKLNLIVESNKSVTFSSPIELGYSYDGTNLLDKISQPDNGSLTKNKDGTYTYTPDADYTGHDGIAYTLKNSLDNKFTDIIGITVIDTDDFLTLETGNAKISNT